VNTRLDIFTEKKINGICFAMCVCEQAQRGFTWCRPVERWRARKLLFPCDICIKHLLCVFSDLI